MPSESRKVDLASITLRPWGFEDPELVQAVAETLASVQEERHHPIVDIVRESSLDAVLGLHNSNPAYRPNNFSRDEDGDEGVPNKLVWNLPAHGLAKASCGHFMRSKTFGCPEGHEIHAVKCNCHRMDCPTCYPEALRRGAKRIAMHLDVVDQLNAGLSGWHHVIASPPQEWAVQLSSTKDGFKALRKSVNDTLMDCGAIGGVSLFHPYRQNDKAITWRIGPHFHAIVYGRVDSSKRPEGWVLVVDPRKDNVGPVTPSRFFPLAYYILSHAGLAEGVTRTPSYFGCCSTAGEDAPVRVAKYDLDVPRHCKECDGSLFNFTKWMGSDPSMRGFIEPKKERQRFYVWTARKDKKKAEALLDGKTLEEAWDIVESNPWMVRLRDASESGEVDPAEIDSFLSIDDAGSGSENDYSSTNPCDYGSTNPPTQAHFGAVQAHFLGDGVYSMPPWDTYKKRPVRGRKRKRKAPAEGTTRGHFFRDLGQLPAHVDGSGIALSRIGVRGRWPPPRPTSVARTGEGDSDHFRI